jgi:hypothetical protein
MFSLLYKKKIAMKIFISFLSFICLLGTVYAQDDIPNREEQINGAIQAAPEDQRAGATVMGYNSNGELVVIKEGNNESICLADDPNKPGFNSACYHKELEPFMKRGRELNAEGKNSSEKFEIREQEAKSGVLKMPEKPATLHVLYGKDATYNPKSGEVENVNYRYVIYIPLATSESTGLPLKPMVKGGPWLMFPGSYGAHIMISPPWPEE